MPAMKILFTMKLKVHLNMVTNKLTYLLCLKKLMANSVTFNTKNMPVLGSKNTVMLTYLK